MDTQPPVTPSTPAIPIPPPSSRGIFGTGLPTSIAFVLGTILFLMPFVDLKCNNMIIERVTGLQLATGFKVEKQQNNSMFGNAETNLQSRSDDKLKSDFALVALLLAVIAAVLSFLKFGNRAAVCAVAGILTVVALIGTAIDVKRQLSINLGEHKLNDNGLNMNFGGSADVINADFTGAFYFTILLFIAGAVL